MVPSRETLRINSGTRVTITTRFLAKGASELSKCVYTLGIGRLFLVALNLSYSLVFILLPACLLHSRISLRNDETLCSVFV